MWPELWTNPKTMLCQSPRNVSWTHLFDQSCYVFAFLNKDAFLIVGFSSDVYSQLHFIRLRFWSLYFNRHSCWPLSLPNVNVNPTNFTWPNQPLHLLQCELPMQYIFLQNVLQNIWLSGTRVTARIDRPGTRVRFLSNLRTLIQIFDKITYLVAKTWAAYTGSTKPVIWYCFINIKISKFTQLIIA